MTRKFLLIALLSIPAAFAAPQEDLIYYRDGARIDPVEVFRVLARTGPQRSLRLLPEASPEASATSALNPTFGTPVVLATAAPLGAPRIAEPAAATPAPPAPRAQPEAIALPVQFAFDSAEILPAARAQLDAVAKGIKMLPEANRVLIEGHTDSSGSHAYNLQLSQRRAEAVKHYIASEHGVDGRRLQTIGFGEERPLDGVDLNAPQNRRVQFRGA